MKKETIVFISEQVMEICVGSTVGVITRELILPQCDNAIEKALAIGGSLAGTWYICRRIGFEILRWSDNTLGTKFNIDEME